MPHTTSKQKHTAVAVTTMARMKANQGHVALRDQLTTLDQTMATHSNSIGKAFLTLRESANYANCSTITLRRAVRAKSLPHHRFGTSETHGKIFIKATDLEAYIQRCRLGAAI